MNILIDNRSGSDLPLSRVEELADFVAEREQLSADVELSLSFVDIAEITELNTRYRGKPVPTDVLSFECDDPWDITEPANAAALRLLGDIVINADVARTHAAAEEVSLEEEIWILIIHGILHLIGYDHVEAEEAELMEAREDEHFYQWQRHMERP